MGAALLVLGVSGWPGPLLITLGSVFLVLIMVQILHIHVTTLHGRNHRWHALLVRGQSALVGGVACAPSCGMVDWLSAAYCGGQAAGARSIFAYGVLPATMPRFISYLLYRWEETIRATVVIGLVGAGGLGRLLTNQLVNFNYQGVLTTLIVFVSITFAVDLVSALARSAFRG